MAKKKRSKKSKKKVNNSTILRYIAWALAVIALSLAAVLIGYYFGYKDAQHKAIKEAVHEKKIAKKEAKQKSFHKRLQALLKKESKAYNSASHEISSESLAHPPQIVKIPKVIPNHRAKKAKLAIIIDDVQTAKDVRAIKSLHLPLTMSFLPPRPGRPNSAKLAAKEPFYMVHLPLEAMHFSANEPNTLRVSDSQEKIDKQIALIKREFPRVHYINNHTGSKFTDSKAAMERLIRALDANHINFIDSRTIGSTKAPIVEKEFHNLYVARDVFLDHHMDKAYVLHQIKEAIRVAKAHGHAIAIGHPHKNTLEAIYESKALLKNVDLVLVKDLY
jgi:polysaccharide deacetylase 2 family uncharacterized protein YibQ